MTLYEEDEKAYSNSYQRMVVNYKNVNFEVMPNYFKY